MKKKSTTLLIVLCCMMALFFSCDSGGGGGSEACDSGGSGGSEAEAIKLPVVGSVIPDGAYFANTNSDLGYNLEYSNIKVAGEAFPDTFQTGDVFLYNGYMYIYGFDVDGNSITDGWSVIVADDCYEAHATAAPGRRTVYYQRCLRDVPY